MGWRFRKSVKVGPFRINLSKSGVGYSYGVKGYRVTKGSNGRTRKTMSIPGTGISYVTESVRSKKSKSDSTIWAIIGVIIIVFVVLIAISN